MQFRFGDHSLDTERRELRRGDTLVALEPQVFDLLVYLVQNRDRVVSKDDLLKAVWDGRIVSESALTSRITAVRKAIKDDARVQRLIRTVPRKGLRFIADVCEEAGAAAKSRPVPRLSIVVLPFVNLGNDREQQYFADGITEDLTTDLSKLANMFVISRNTAFTYRNNLIGTKQIGRELGVRYVLEGSVRRSGSQLRISAQLIDAETEAHLWAERFDGDTRDLFAVQDEITSRIAVALNLEMITAEAARPTDNPDALDYVLRGRAARLRPNSRDAFALAIDLFEQALALDPNSVEAQSQLAISLAGRALELMADSAATDIERAKELSEQAAAASPRNPLAHFAKGQVLRALGRYAEAIAEYEIVLASDRNWVGALHALGQCEAYTGSIEKTIGLVERAIRLSPRDPQLGVWYWQIGFVHLLQSRVEEAIVWLEKARNTASDAPYVHSWLASAYGLNGETARAAAELAEARRASRDDRYSSLASLRKEYCGIPKLSTLLEDTFFVGIRKAGMPEE